MQGNHFHICHSPALPLAGAACEAPSMSDPNTSSAAPESKLSEASAPAKKAPVTPASLLQAQARRKSLRGAFGLGALVVGFATFSVGFVVYKNDSSLRNANKGAPGVHSLRMLDASRTPLREVQSRMEDPEKARALGDAQVAEARSSWTRGGAS